MATRAIDRLADYLCAVTMDHLPVRIVERVGDCVLDVIGAAVSGRSQGSARAAMQAATETFGPGDAGVWFSEKRSTLTGAAFANAMAATATDIDDGHRAAAGHPGVAVVTAALGEAEIRGLGWDRVVPAVVAGYEAAVRVALSRNPDYNRSTVSGRWAGIGAATAVSKLRNLTAAQMAQAILIAEAHAPKVTAASHHGFAGAHVKEGIAWSVVAGLAAVDLARAGFTGYPDTFDQDVPYNSQALTLCLGDTFAMDGLFFKPYACCRWIHSAIDGLRELMEFEGLTAPDIDRIEVHTFRRAADLGNHVRPQHAEEAQFSIPFCLGMMAVHGKKSLIPLNESMIGGEQVTAIAEKVSVHLDESIDAEFPTFAGARVVVHSAGKRSERTVISAFGDPGNPMSRADLQQKFRDLTGFQLTEDLAERAIQACRVSSGPDQPDIRELFACLRANLQV